MNTQIIVVEKGSVDKSHIKRLLDADIPIMEVSDISKVKFLTLEPPDISGNDLADCAIHALAKNDSSFANTIFIKALDSRIKESKSAKSDINTEMKEMLQEVFNWLSTDHDAETYEGLVVPIQELLNKLK